MDKLETIKNLIKTVTSKELDRDDTVVANSFALNPVILEVGLKGDGSQQELIKRYQLDFFYEAKGKTMAKAIALQEALSDYVCSDCSFIWEQNALLWLGTFSIEFI